MKEKHELKRVVNPECNCVLNELKEKHELKLTIRTYFYRVMKELKDDYGDDFTDWERFGKITTSRSERTSLGFQKI